MAFVRQPVEVNGNAIRIMRIVKGLSQRELGQLAGLAPHKVFRIEHALDAPTDEEVAKLLGALSTEGGK